MKTFDAAGDDNFFRRLRINKDGQPVKVVIFGGTGQTGRLLVERAVFAGHEVTVFARDPARASARRESVRLVLGDVLDAASLPPAVVGQEAVLVALGTATRGSPPVLPQGLRHILDTMEAHGVRRIIVLSAAGALHEPAGSVVGSLGLKVARSLLPGVYREHRAMLEVLRTSDLDWIAVRPVILTNGPWTGRYRAVVEGIPRRGYRISRADVADFMLRQLTSDQFVRKMPAIAA
ncbi:MAG TPA: SDR family oxidoreductase [Thermoplasmata archaeon]|nr:SDR family oxidoreductase [Thermoplasmata archaeon]